MILVSIGGGLGNQLFQYAAGYALARRHASVLVADLGTIATDTQRSYMLDKLHIEPMDVVRVPKTYLSQVLYSFGNTRLPSRFRDRGFFYDQSFESIAPPVWLRGNFQSERYFDSVASEIRARFVPVDALSRDASLIAAKIAAANRPTVALHVRHGDYPNGPNASPFFRLDRAYYDRALRALRALVGGDLELFVFSDDPDYVETAFASMEVTVVRGDPNRPWEDLTLMRSCQHFIIANSSFSWWGAWLSNWPEKVVIAPRNWFSPEWLRRLNVCDLFPEGWILV